MTKSKFRAWHKTWEEMGKVKRIRFDDDGNMTKVLFIGKKFGTNENIDEIDLMQFIGLKDMNGQEIFEGDVVHAYSESASLIGVIEYFDNAYCIKSKNGIYNSLWTNAEYFEVIGNIYENKELLKK